MKKLKLFMTALALIGGMNVAFAQTDVTSTYLTNADFSQTTALTSTYLYGYGKDGSPYGFQTVDGWTSVVTAGDNSNASYPNSGTAAGVFSYGSSTQLKGNSKAAPDTNPNGEASGNCFGFFGVWSCGGYYYQEVTLAAGKYTITVPMYNQSGTQANTTYTGFFPTSGTNQTVAVNPTVGQWVNQTVTFTLAAETAGQIRIGYQSTGSGSGANPMLFIDCVKIEFTAIVVKDILESALSAANKANTALGTLDDAIATAQSVYDDDNATQDEVNAAAATLNVAVELAMSEAGDVTGMFIVNADLSSLEGWTSYASGASGTNYQDYSNGLIGTYNVRFNPATVDDTHLDTEYCFGFECRWSTNYASYYQTTDPVPPGVYTLTFDVQNVNGATTSANYDNLFYMKAGSNKVTDSATEWMQGGTSWTTHTIRITIEEATPLTVSFGYGTGNNNIGSANTPALYVSHIKLNYSSFLAGAKAEWDEAVAAAEQAKTDCPNVTGEELTALNEELAKAEPTTIDGYNAATAALESATTTFTAAKAAYDAYAEISGVAVALGITLGDAPANAAAAPAATHTLNVAVYDATTADNIFDVTEVYNPSWTDMGTSSGQHWSGDTGISYADKWEGSAVTTTRTATITLPTGSYILMSAGRGSENETSTMSANGTTVTFASNGDTGKGIDINGAANFDEGTFANEGIGRGWEWRYIPVELSAETDVTVTQTLTRSGAGWGSFCDFRILKKGVVADADDYAALNAAISAAEAKTLGFEVGQYAPYNNVAALEALAAAKTFDQTATNEKETVEAVTASLTSATWTTNDGDVDAIYNGTFAETGIGNNPKGWTRSNNGWGQQITGLTAEANSVAEGTTTAWYYNNNGAWQYGNDGVYTMPLAADQAYVLSFKYRKHNNDWQNGMKASVLNSDSEGIEVAQFPGADNGTIFQSAKAYFTTGAAGNYILSIEQDGNAHLTDVSLVKAESTEYALSEEAEAAPAEMAYYETVALTRTLSSSYWNTFSVPFDAAIPEGWTVKEFVSAEDNTLNFSAATTIQAGVPYLVKPEADVENPTFEGVLVKATEGETVSEGDYQFAAQIYNKSLATDGSIAYLATDGTIKKLTSGGLKGLRAYFVLPTSTPEGARIAFIDDGGTTTGIESVASGVQKVENGVYDLQGRRVEAMKKGLYIVNGKKVVK